MSERREQYQAGPPNRIERWRLDTGAAYPDYELEVELHLYGGDFIEIFSPTDNTRLSVMPGEVKALCEALMSALTRLDEEYKNG